MSESDESDESSSRQLLRDFIDQNDNLEWLLAYGEMFGVTPYCYDRPVDEIKSEIFGIWQETRHQAFFTLFQYLTKHEKEFNLSARHRMIMGSRMLLPMLKKYLWWQIQGKVIEFGPFVNPLVTPTENGLWHTAFLNITYYDNEPRALAYLNDRFNKFPQKPIITVCGNFKDIDKNLTGRKYDYMIMSQIFNYMDFRAFFQKAREHLNKNGLIFINNVADYGIPEYFAPSGKRPESDEDVLWAAKELGFEIVEHECIQSIDPSHQIAPRLLAVIRKNK